MRHHTWGLAAVMLIAPALAMAQSVVGLTSPVAACPVAFAGYYQGPNWVFTVTHGTGCSARYLTGSNLFQGRWNPALGGCFDMRGPNPQPQNFCLDPVPSGVSPVAFLIRYCRLEGGGYGSGGRYFVCEDVTGEATVVRP